MSDVITKLANEANDKAAEIARLNAENAKLRNEVDNLLDFEHLTSVAVAYAGCDECGEYKQTMLRLFADNAKLRELVSELWVSCPVHDSDCDECQHKGGRTGCELYDRMRELGVDE